MKGINYGRFISVYQSQDGDMYYNNVLVIRIRTAHDRVKFTRNNKFGNYTYICIQDTLLWSTLTHCSH